MTLVGTGGVGKTRLAAEVCASVRAAGDGRMWFCELAAADPTTVMVTVATALGVDQRAGTDHLERIGEVLRVQAGLLVLDNCEHVIDEAAEVAEVILSRAPGVRVLATSRERLAVDGEHLVPVGPPARSAAVAPRPSICSSTGPRPCARAGRPPTRSSRW